MNLRCSLAGRGRVFLVEDESVLVTKEHIDKVVGNLERNGQFGTDNRAGFPGKLHRISVMRDKVSCVERWRRYPEAEKIIL